MPTRIRVWALDRRILLAIRHGDVFVVVELDADAAQTLANDLAWAEDIASHKPGRRPQFHEIHLNPETES